jgi:hypothetical protein
MKCVGIRKMEFLHSYFYLNAYSKEEVSSFNESLCSIIERIGEVSSGDEKLFHFTGHSMNVRVVPSKREVGLWIYELTVRITSGKTLFKTIFNIETENIKSGASLLIFAQMHSAEKGRNQSVPVHEVVKAWCDILKNKGHENTMLMIDSYYFSSKSREVILHTGVHTIASVKPDRFSSLISLLNPGIINSGDCSSIYNSSSNELLIFYFHPDPTIGRKYVWTNAYQISSVKPKKNSIAVFDDYHHGFRICDDFNHLLHGKHWQFRTGSERDTAGGDLRRFFDFILSSVLQNTFAIFDMQSNSTLIFAKHCEILAEELYEFAESQLK